MGLDKDDIKALIAILQKGLTDDDSASEPEQVVSQTKTKKTKQPKSTVKSNSKPINKFNSMPEASMHKDDSLIDKKLSRFPPTERSRSYKPLSVKCRVCGSTEKINPSLVDSIERYKCNKCATSPG